MTNTLSLVTGQTIEKITNVSESLLDDESGALPSALSGFREELEQLLGDAFDADSKSSILGRFESAQRELLQDQRTQFARLINADSPDSPLGSWRNAIEKTVKEQTESVLREVRDLHEKVAATAAADVARAEALEKGTQKGFAFEDLLHGLIEPAAAACGDLAEQTGRTQGACGTLKGDEVVTINPDDLRGRRGAYTVEKKDRNLSTQKTFEELEASMANRDAVVGIAVFSSQENAPTTLPFQPFGDKAIVMIDKNDPDPHLVRLMHLWARMTVRRAVGEAGETDALDLEKMEALITDARRALKRITTIKGAHSKVKKSVDQAAVELAELEDELSEVLDRLCDELSE